MMWVVIMKLGLVLSGGGSTGAYQMGVIKALQELKINPDIVVGTSIGSINGAMYVSGGIEQAYNMWNELSFASVFDKNIEYNSQKDEFMVIRKYVASAIKGGIEPNNLKANLIKYVDLDKFYKSPIDYGLATVSFPSLRSIKLTKKEIAKEKLLDYIIASATVYPIFKLKKIDNKRYIDGGVRDTIPYDLAIKLGAEKIIIVNTSYFFKYAKIPKKITNKYEVTIIRPRNNTGPSLMFEAKQARKNIKYGYNDAMKILGNYEGNKYTFKSVLEYDESFKDKKEYINVLENLGRIFKLDDTRIYQINEYNKCIKNKLDKVALKRVKSIQNIKDILNSQERIKYIYNKIKNNDAKAIKIIKRILYKEYLGAYYLYKLYN